MLDNIAEWFSGLATISGAGYFTFGFFSCYVGYWVWCKIKHRKLAINWRYAGIALGLCVIVFVSLQSQRSYTIAKNTAQEVQECQREFQSAIKASREISNVNDALSVQQRDLLAAKDRAETMMWLKLLDPPYPISGMEDTNPTRKAYGIQVVREYAVAAKTIDNFVSGITQKQVMLARYRPPLPEPSCGKI